MLTPAFLHQSTLFRVSRCHNFIKRKTLFREKERPIPVKMAGTSSGTFSFQLENPTGLPFTLRRPRPFSRNPGSAPAVVVVVVV